jgi:hypothetical protein
MSCKKSLVLFSVSDLDSLSPDPDPAFYTVYRSGSGSGSWSNQDPKFWWTKYEGKNLQLKKKIHIFFDQKSKFTYPLASIKDVQAAGEAFSSQKSTQKMKFQNFFFCICGSFLPSWIRIRIPNPDPLNWLNSDPLRIRIRNTGIVNTFHPCCLWIRSWGPTRRGSVTSCASAWPCTRGTGTTTWPQTTSWVCRDQRFRISCSNCLSRCVWLEVVSFDTLHLKKRTVSRDE